MDGELTVASLLGGAVILIAAALLSAVLIVLLRPLLARYAIVRPNARSSHTMPTPQGGGIAVIAAALGVSGATLYFFPVGTAAAVQLLLVSVAVVFIAGVGVLADVHPENVVLRLLLQTLAVTAVIFVLPPGLRILPILPLAAERIALVIGGLWFVNLVNFMDGLDWMTAAETVPIAAALAVIGLLGPLPPVAIIVSLALCGAMIGFGYFNRPVARLFLGDVGSLPVGLLLGWLLVLLAGNGGRAAAILLPLYYLAELDHHTRAPRTKRREDLAGASLAFLSARHGSRLYCHRRCGARIRSQCCAGNACDLDSDSEVAHHGYCRAEHWRRPCSRSAIRAGARARQTLGEITGTPGSPQLPRSMSLLPEHPLRDRAEHAVRERPYRTKQPFDLPTSHHDLQSGKSANIIPRNCGFFQHNRPKADMSPITC